MTEMFQALFMAFVVYVPSPFKISRCGTAEKKYTVVLAKYCNSDWKLSKLYVLLCCFVKPCFICKYANKNEVGLLQTVCLCLAAYSSSYHEKAIKALQRARLGVTGHMSITPKWRGNAR